MTNVSMVVERGLARCPRCVSMADYVFIETVSEHDSPVTRYEVRCRKCGQSYGEESQPPQYAPVPVAAEPPIIWPPDQEPVPPRDWRRELRERATKLSAEAADTAQRVRGEALALLRPSARAVKARIPARSLGREEPDHAGDDQTGG